MILDKWDYRVLDILSGIKTFIQETDLELTYNGKKAIDYLWALWEQPSIRIICNYQNDNFAGFAIIAKSEEFHDEALGYVSKFYVMPEYRGSVAGREIFTELTDLFDVWDVKYSWITDTGEVKQSKLFQNLAAKFGYARTGPTLIRRTHE